MTRPEYISKYTNAAIAATKGTGLFPSVLIGQGVIESNNGNSLLTKLYHNHFGIKADKGWHGKKVNLKTREVYNGNSVIEGDYFRVYDSDEEGFKDRTAFLKNNPRYAKVFTAKTPTEQVKALKNAGYATDPNYVDLVTGIINKYKLSLIDTVKKKRSLIVKIAGFALLAGISYKVYKKFNN